MNCNRDGTSADSSLLHHVLAERDRQQLLDVLREPVRRQVLRDLDPEEGRVALSDLAERVANHHVRGASGFASGSSDDATVADYTFADRSSADADSANSEFTNSGCATSGSATSDPADANPIDRVALRLHHVHLPKLADYGIVEYDHRERTVTPRTSF